MLRIVLVAACAMTCQSVCLAQTGNEIFPPIVSPSELGTSFTIQDTHSHGSPMTDGIIYESVPMVEMQVIPRMPTSPQGNGSMMSKQQELDMKKAEEEFKWAERMQAIRAQEAKDRNRQAYRHALAGNPLCVKPNARCTYDNRYTGYYVGGGTPLYRAVKFTPNPRTPQEGTFGVDFDAIYSRVNLNYSHGYLYQDGTGAYEPDHKNWPFGIRRGIQQRYSHMIGHGEGGHGEGGHGEGGHGEGGHGEGGHGEGGHGEGGHGEGGHGEGGHGEGGHGSSSHGGSSHGGSSHGGGSHGGGSHGGGLQIRPAKVVGPSK